MKIRILSQNDVKRVITMKEAIEAMRNAFSQLASGDVTLPLRTPISMPDDGAISLFMPAYLRQKKQIGVKIISLFPENLKKGIPSINGGIVLLDGQTGLLKAVIDAGYLTGLRTGAISGLATELLAKKDATQVAILGSGVQAQFQLEAVRAVRNIEKVFVYSRTFENAEKFAEKSRDKKINAIAVKRVEEALKDADIICSTTPAETAFISLKDLKKDCHINAIGSHSLKMREIADDVLGEAFVVVDQISAALKEAGEIVSAIEAGKIKESDIRELGNILNENTDTFRDKITVFKSVGLAIQDISCAEMAYDKAVSLGMGTEVEF